MFSGIIEVKKLHPIEVLDRTVNDINDLLKQQYSRVEPIDKNRLLSHMGRSKVVVGVNDERLIAMGVLVKTSCVSHEFASIHNLIVREGYDVLTIGLRMVKLLIEEVGDVEFIDAGVWLQDDNLVEILTALGFKEKPRSRFRLRL